MWGAHQGKPGGEGVGGLATANRDWSFAIGARPVCGGLGVGLPGNEESNLGPFAYFNGAM